MIESMLICTIIIMAQVKAGSVERGVGLVKEDTLSINEIFYTGYPGYPVIPPGHKMSEQIPGYSHPYLPGPNIDINVDHFLWTGTGDFGNSLETPITHSVESQIHGRPTAVSFGVKHRDWGRGYPSPSRHTANQGSTEGERYRGNVLNPPPHTGLTPTSSYFHMPHPKYLIRTVIKNGTDLLKRSVDIQAFKREMEERLTLTYRQAFKQQSTRAKRNIATVDKIQNRRVTRAGTRKPEISVKIHNIRSALPKLEIEMLYAVYKHDHSSAYNSSSPVLAVDAVNAINENVNNDDAVKMLGHPLKIKAQPYDENPSSLRSNSTWVTASIILTIFLIILIIWVIILIYRQYKRKEKLHDTLVSSVASSRYPSPVAPRKGDPQRDFHNGAFAPDELKPMSMIQDDKIDFDKDRKTRKDLSQSTQNLNARIQGMNEDCASEDEERSSAGESPSLADHSSNNTPDPGKRSKRGTKIRKDRKNSRGLGRSTLTSDEDASDSAFPLESPFPTDSAFPARTPDNLRQLDDLIEEDGVAIHGDSIRNQTGSAFLPMTLYGGQEDCWRDSGVDARRNSELYSKTLNQTCPPSQSGRGDGAKSQIVRKNIQSKLSDMKRGNETRPWSAHESRWNADPMFDTKQRNWEGLIKGRKHLHHGQLLPGSTESEEEAKASPELRCWSEGASPDRKDQFDPATPLIQAIRTELQRFQPTVHPNTTGITIENDPEILPRESQA